MSQTVFEVTLRNPGEHMPRKNYHPTSLLFSDESFILPSLQQTYCEMKGVVAIEDKRAEGAMFIVRHEDRRADIFDVTKRNICTMPEHF